MIFLHLFNISFYFRFTIFIFPCIFRGTQKQITRKAVKTRKFACKVCESISSSTLMVNKKNMLENKEIKLSFMFMRP